MQPKDQKIALSAREAYSYAWCRADMDTTCFVVSKYCGAVKAFISGLFCGYKVNKWNLTNVCYEYHNSFIDKRYPLIMNRNVQKENIEKKECTQKDFSYIMCDGSFSDDIHYVATETLVLEGIIGASYFPDRRGSMQKSQSLSLPKNLTVQGDFVYSGKLNKHKLMAFPQNFGKLNKHRLMAFPQNFTVEGSLHINNCTLPKDLSKHNIRASDNIIFSDCDGMQYAPNILKMDGVSSQTPPQFTRCKDLEKIPEARI